MARFMTLFTLVPSVFTLIAVILINIGGISSNRPYGGTNSSLSIEKNHHFNLINWRFIILSPDRSSRSYTSHLYLHRICNNAIINSKGNSCRSISTLTDRNAWTNSSLLNFIRPFVHSSVNLKVPFAFYVLSAICAFVLICLAVAGFVTRSRVVRLVGVVISTIGFITTLVASSVLTWQTRKLKTQIQNGSRRSALGPARGNSSSANRDIYSISLSEITLGKTVMGLTWTAVVLMLVGMGLWVLSMREGRKEKRVVREEKEMGDGFVDGARV